MTSLDATQTLKVGDKEYRISSLQKAVEQLGDIDRLPRSLKVLLENLLRRSDSEVVQPEDLQALVDWQHQGGQSDREIAYQPARVLMQDFTGVPGVADLAAMRDAVSALGEDPQKVNPLSPVDLVIDHSVMVDHFASPDAFRDNVRIEMERNRERYAFLRWGQTAFDNFRVVPPGTGICHQVNLEYLGKTVWTAEQDGHTWAYPDTLVGTDSHTTMINGLGILGWGVGGIEAEAAMLGQPVSMLIPEVVGFKLTGALREGITATDLVLTVTEMLRQHGVVGKFVEFYGDGLAQLPLADRATLSNMAPEYGATCGFFPVDEETLRYLRLSGRSEEQVALVEAYCKEQGLWRHPGDEPVFTSRLELDLSTVEASLAGPKRPQDRVALHDLKSRFDELMALNLTPAPGDDVGKLEAEGGQPSPGAAGVAEVEYDGQRFTLDHGSVVIAAITSCTNTSNPGVMLAAGLLARKAVAKGLTRQPWVKSSLAPGSKVVTDYLQAAGVDKALDQLGFNLVGYGCTTCIGNSGPLPEPIEHAIRDQDLTVASVLSGNRNFEGRVHPAVKTNWLASPPLVVAFALAGRVDIDLEQEPLGEDAQGNPVFLKDLWPSQQEVADALEKVNTEMFRREYGAVFDGDAEWQSIEVATGNTYNWPDSTYIQQPPFFDGMQPEPEATEDIDNARILALLGDSVTTDHISPAGAIKPDSPAGRYLQEQGVTPEHFNSYGSRRGNHEVMMRGTFANIRIRNEMLEGVEGGETRHYPSGEQLAIYDAAMRYQEEGRPLVVIAGKEYGTGSSRDWAAKGTRLLGVRAVIAESFERIHRSNLLGMGILPLEFVDTDRKALKLTGEEEISLNGLGDLSPRQTLTLEVRYPDGQSRQVPVRCRIDTGNELAYFRHGGILHFVLRRMIGKA
ncbi:aconitate hydratase AcnA [Marinobacterium sp. AK62]|uniref:Aconitate hydratase n=1 Tax=Marinobacterium alkalitolerans TaxID=1542925 RepID=A0ABS3ZA26_9GAMM|nr:aconitate hydratase AcnA [Marinobacterium alkalitolerans]MBP0047894.1 aconitate hydratase AcnA [Marinobacterium alkalitolerans]